MSRLRVLLNERQRALVMGVVNRTPDSFSDGGRFVDAAAAIAHIERLIADGADIIDIGAESTRPGSKAIPADEQIARIGGAVREAAQRGVIVSIDTTLPEVAEQAIADGASVVNTVSLEPAAALGALCARTGAALVLMHCRGSMTSMRGFSVYEDAAYVDVVADVGRELVAAAEIAMAAGIAREEILLDPGLGFAKNARQSIELCARLDELCALGFPVLVGPSRKSFIARAEASADDRGPRPLAPAESRLGGTVAASLACVARGAAVVRAHDVVEVRQALAVASSIESAGRAARRAQQQSQRPAQAGSSPRVEGRSHA